MPEPIEEKETTGEEESLKKEKPRRESLVKWLSVIFVIIVVVILFIIKWQNPDFPLKWVFIIGIPLIIIGAIVFFAFDIYRKYQEHKAKTEKGVLPPAASEETILKRLNDEVTNNNRRNHIKRYIPQRHTVGKNLIYLFSLQLLYADEDLGNTAYAIVNAHYPDDIPTLLPGTVSLREVKLAVNAASLNPEPEPDVEVTTSESPLLGTKTTTRKTAHRGRPKKKPQSKEELA
jgi:hypothetical protein